MAEAFAKARTPEGVEALSAAIRAAAKAHPMAVKAMTEGGIDISRQSLKAFSNLQVREIDLVITLCATAAKEYTLVLPGPPRVDWDLPDPAAVEGSSEQRLAAFRQTRDKIGRLIDDLFARGYLKALARANQKANLVLNSLSEGVIAHDTNRRITFFSRAAEAITGYSRHEVMGRDCHDVFPGNFCGAKCSFCNECPSFERARYPVDFTTKTGEQRLLEMSVRAIKDDNENMLGVLAFFRDLTLEHDMARRLGEIESFSGIIGRDKNMLEIFGLIRSVADSNVPVLIQGETGTGKELVA